MKSFCIEMTTITGGIIARIEVAMMTGQSAVSSPEGEHLLDPHHNGIHLRICCDEKWPEILVPSIDEQNNEQCRHIRAAHRHDDIQKEPHRPRPIHTRRLCQLVRDRHSDYASRNRIPGNDATMRHTLLYSCIFLEEEMVGVTGIEPVTPTMST